MVRHRGVCMLCQSMTLFEIIASTFGNQEYVHVIRFGKIAGTDALVNAILVARGDSLPTEFAAEKLEINPKLPFLGSSAYHVRIH
jgi:hypothetical protein